LGARFGPDAGWNPIRYQRSGRHRWPMLTQRVNDSAANELLRAADAVEDIDAHSDMLPARLDRLADALRAARRAYEAAASQLVPSAEPFDQSIADRYRRAAEAWPAEPPPHERFAAALRSLHTAADAARLAARRCDEARRAVDRLWDADRRS
jgi:hypothetical protein